MLMSGFPSAPALLTPLCSAWTGRPHEPQLPRSPCVTAASNAPSTAT